MTTLDLALTAAVLLTGALGYAIGRSMTPALPCQYDHGNPLRKAINAALMRGYQPDLVQGWEQRRDYVRAELNTGIDVLTHELRLLDASCLAELVGRGYESNHRHMHTLGWLAHSIGFDVRQYEGDK